MRVVFLSLAFFFTQAEIRNVRSNSSAGSENLNLAKWTGSSSNPQSPPGSSSILCKRSNVKSGAADAHSTCRHKCLALKAEISTICNAYPNYMIFKRYCSMCGPVTEGECIAVVSFPLCWCHTPTQFKNQRSTPLGICRKGIQIMRKVINNGTIPASDISATSTIKPTEDTVLMYQAPFPRPPTRRRSPRPRPGTRPGTHPSSFGPRPVSSSAGSSAGPSAGPSVLPPSPPQQQEEDWNSRPDGEPEGDILWTDVQVSGEVVRAKLDTGAAISIIHQKYAVNMVPVESASISGVDNRQFRILGKTTINVEIRRGISIPVTGLVTDRRWKMLLGNDFFDAYAAKINILDRNMEIFTGQTKVTMTIKFRTTSGGLFMAQGDHFHTPLCISARLNGRDTRVVIDTGASWTIVNKNFVNQQTLFPVTRQISIAGSDPVGFLGGTNINLQIESKCFIVPALVPDFIPTRNLILGNEFNKMCVELIDYGSKLVTLRFPGSSGYDKVTTNAFVNGG